MRYIGPTLLELAGLEPPPTESLDEGRSLVELWSGSEKDDVPTSPPRFAGGNLYGLPAVLVEDGPWRSILRANGTQELYDLIHDPEERYNVALEHPEVAARLRQLLEPRLEVFVQNLEGEMPERLSSEQLEALRALGYVR